MPTLGLPMSGDSPWPGASQNGAVAARDPRRAPGAVLTGSF